MQSKRETANTFPGFETANVIRTCREAAQIEGRNARVGGVDVVVVLEASGEVSDIALLGTLESRLCTNISFHCPRK